MLYIFFLFFFRLEVMVQGLELDLAIGINPWKQRDKIVIFLLV